MSVGTRLQEVGEVVRVSLCRVLFESMSQVIFGDLVSIWIAELAVEDACLNLPGASADYGSETAGEISREGIIIALDL
jgi:hypothetical protein